MDRLQIATQSTRSQDSSHTGTEAFGNSKEGRMQWRNDRTGKLIELILNGLLLDSYILVTLQGSG